MEFEYRLCIVFLIRNFSMYFFVLFFYFVIVFDSGCFNSYVQNVDNSDVDQNVQLIFNERMVLMRKLKILKVIDFKVVYYYYII